MNRHAFPATLAAVALIASRGLFATGPATAPETARDVARILNPSAGSSWARDGPDAPSVRSVRSASYYLYLPTGPVATPIPHMEILANEQIDFPSVRAAGYNTVLLVEFRRYFDPNFDNVYSQEGLDTFRAELETARQNDLRDIFGLNYGSGLQIGGGSDRGSSIPADARFRSWLGFVEWLLASIDDYRDMAYPVVFEEGQLDVASFGGDLVGAEISGAVPEALLRTIGNTPALLPPKLRRRWLIGWYGNASNLYAPFAPAAGFDFVCFGQYFFDESFTFWHIDHSLSDTEVEDSLSRSLAYLSFLFPDTPRLLYEGGYYTCDSGRLRRAGEVYGLIARFCVEHDLGINLWGYRSLLTPERECEIRDGKGGHSLNDPDGSPRPAQKAVTEVFRSERMVPLEPRLPR